MLPPAFNVTISTYDCMHNFPYYKSLYCINYKIAWEEVLVNLLYSACYNYKVICALFSSLDPNDVNSKQLYTANIDFKMERKFVSCATGKTLGPYNLFSNPFNFVTLKNNSETESCIAYDLNLGLVDVACSAGYKRPVFCEVSCNKELVLGVLTFKHIISPPKVDNIQ